MKAAHARMITLLSLLTPAKSKLVTSTIVIAGGVVWEVNKVLGETDAHTVTILDNEGCFVLIETAQMSAVQIQLDAGACAEAGIEATPEAVAAYEAKVAERSAA
jgi:hypothetical protein